MAKVVPVHIQGGKTLLMEVDENVQMSDVATQHGHEGDGLQGKGRRMKPNKQTYGQSRPQNEVKEAM